MTPRTRRFLWLAAFAVGFSSLAVATPILLNAAAVAAGAKAGQDSLEVVNHVKRGVRVLEYSGSKPELVRIAFLGDSTVTAYEWQHAVPNYLERALAARPLDDKRPKVVSLAFPGMGSIGYYFLADMIGAASPDLIVWETSFTHVSARWWRRNARPGLVGWLDSGRLLETLMLPLDDLGISLDELLLYKILVGAGADEAWHSLRTAQSRIDKWRRLLEKRIAGTTGLRPESRFSMRVGLSVSERSHRLEREVERYNSRLEREHYGAALTKLDPEHPAIMMLRGGLAHFRSLGIPVVVYLNPINVANLGEVGLLDSEAIAQSVEIYRRAAEDNGATFLDLHDAFPDRYFRDAPGHFTSDEEVNGPAELAAALAEPVRRALGPESRGFP